MPVTGRPPKPKGQAVNRVRLTHDWEEFENVPFEGAPRLPSRGDGLAWPRRTRQWWKAISTMPHCVAWTPTDWQYAFDAALLAAEFHLGNQRVENQLRAREKVMGTTADYRRAIRIHYVDPRPEVEEDEDEEAAGVASLEAYRRALEE